MLFFRCLGRRRDLVDFRLSGSEQRQELRGRDPARSAERERARQSLEQRGFDSPASSNRQARERAQTADRDLRSQPLRQPDQLRSNAQTRQQARQQYAAGQGARNNAFAGARAPSQARVVPQIGNPAEKSLLPK